MTFRLDPDRPVRKEVRRVALEQLEDARLATAVGDVHAARKALKRVRAVHRLAGAKRKDDRLLRDAGRLLAGARDAEVLVELFDRLAPHLDASVEEVERARHELRADVEAAAVDEAGAVALLDRAAKRVTRWEVDDVEPGVRATYREARRAMRGSESAPTGERLHEWRKDVKRHWHHCELLGHEARAERVHELADALGDDHDLVVLAERLPDVPGLAERCATRQEELRAKAFDLGEELFGTRPRLAAEQLSRGLPVP